MFVLAQVFVLKNGLKLNNNFSHNNMMSLEFNELTLKINSS